MGHALDSLGANVLVCDSDRPVVQSLITDVKAIAGASLDDAHGELEVMRVAHGMLKRQYSELAEGACRMSEQNAKLVTELARLKQVLSVSGIGDA